MVGLAAGSSAQEPGLGEIARQAGRSFGTAVQGDWLESQADYAAAVLRETTLLVPEYEGKWAAIQPEEGKFEFEPLSRVTRWAAANRKQVRGHALIWHQAMPDWLVAALGEGASRARALMEAHFDRVLETTRGQIRDWDVVNEAVANPRGSDNPQDDGEFRDTPWLRALGKDYIATAFRLARERDATLRLTLNDYGVEADSPWADEKRRRLLALARELVDAKVPLDAVGIQAHLQMDHAFSAEKFRGFVASLRELGLSVLITEMDVREPSKLSGGIAARDEAVARYTKDFLAAAIDGGVRTILTWGITDKHSWLVTDKDVARKDGATHRGLPLDDDYRRKPMWKAMAEVLGKA
ncbi:endo-1,4-beta-xylanase [Acetobacteraceae bacterium H6797]|nr:endo-1,4-beta-xylanase [Acetobacteraceae bacterium H6797]